MGYISALKSSNEQLRKLGRNMWQNRQRQVEEALGVRTWGAKLKPGQLPPNRLEKMIRGYVIFLLKTSTFMIRIMKWLPEEVKKPTEREFRRLMITVRIPEQGGPPAMEYP